MTDAILTVFNELEPLPSGLEIGLGKWPEDESAIAVVRRAVFIEEQHVPEDMEWESADPDCDWFVARHGDAVVAIARLTPQGRIGRMAVLQDWRGRGIGSSLLELAIARAAWRGLAQVELHAQCHAMGFYDRFGFRAAGPEFDEAGIAHRRMVLNLGKD